MMAEVRFTLGGAAALVSLAAAWLAGRRGRSPKAVPRRAAGPTAEQRNLLDASIDGVFQLTWDGRCTYVNRVGLELIGYTEEEVVGRDLKELLSGPVGVRGRSADDLFGLQSARLARSCGITETVLYRKDGAAFEAECLTSLILEDDEVTSVVLRLRNITQRKVVERARLILLEREKALRAAAEAAERRAKFLSEASDLFSSSLEIETTLQTLATLVVPQIADSCVIYVKEESGRITRLQPVHVDPERQRILAEQFARHPPDLATLVPPVRRALAEGITSLLTTVDEAQMKAVPGDLDHRSVVERVELRSLIAVPLRARGRVIGAITYGSCDPSHAYGPEDVVLAEDLASRAALALDNARLYQRARAAVRARNEVLGVVSHDLRNPLAGIRLGVQALLRHWPPADGGEAERGQLLSIRTASERMQRLIGDLLDAAQADAGTLRVHPEPTAIGPILREALQPAVSTADEKSIQVSLSASDALPLVYADSDRVLQVVSNLLDNAIKFSPADSQVRIDASPADQEIVVTITDNGCGIDPDHLPHVFDTFWRGQDGCRRGAGLGLAVAKGIVESHGGRIWVESRPGAGAAFHFTLPNASASGPVPGIR